MKTKQKSAAPDVTLRDYFAAASLPFMLQSDAWDDYDDVAQSAYAIADALLKARAGKGKKSKPKHHLQRFPF